MALRRVGVRVAWLLASLLLASLLIFAATNALPGLGSSLLLAVSQRDLGVVQAIVLLLVWAVLVINFLVDIAYQIIDPRLRRSGESR